VEESPATTTPPTTSEPVLQPAAPAGLVDELSVSLTVEELNIDEHVTVTNKEPIGLFTSVASCSLVEGGGWFPLEIVVSGESFIRLSSATPTPNGIGAIEGQLVYQRQGSVSLEVAVTIYVGDGSGSGTFVGSDGAGRAVSGDFDCGSAAVSNTALGKASTELSIRLVQPDEIGGQRVRRFGFRTTSTQGCPTNNDASQQWQVDNADHPVGGLVSAVLSFDSPTSQWVGEFTIAGETVVVEALTVSTMPNGLVFSGTSVDGMSVDGALTC